MNRISITLVFLVAVLSAHSQILYLHSKDSVNNLPRFEVGFGGWIKLSLVYDRAGIETTASMNPLYIPTGDYTPDPQFTGDMKQSRLKFRSVYRMENFGEITGYVEGDFYGAGNAGFRLRHAYIKNRHWLVGQYWTAFTDPDAWPNVADFDGPSTGIWKRVPQVRYSADLSKTWSMAVSVETSFPEYFRVVDSLQVEELNQNIPNLAAQFIKTYRTGLVQLSGLFRNVRYIDKDSSFSYLQGFGLALTGRQHIRKDLLMYQAAGGKGIASYMSSFGGMGLDIIELPDGGSDLIPTWGGFISFQHFWGKSDFSSNILFGWAVFNNEWLTDYEDAIIGTNSSININWMPNEHICSFLEVQFGTHRDIEGKFGKATRVMFTAEYSF